MLHALRRTLAVGFVGSSMLLLTVLLATPTGAASPFMQAGCANGNFACLRAQGVVPATRFVYPPRYAPAYYAAPQSYVAPMYYAAPQAYAMPVATTCRPGAYPGMMPGTVAYPGMMTGSAPTYPAMMPNTAPMAGSGY